MNRHARNLFVAIDAKGYSDLDATAQEEAQAVLQRLLDDATAAAGLDRLAWSRQPQGDGELALVPGEQREELVVDAFVRELDAQLDRYNHDRRPTARLRLRMAAHFGVGYPADNGYAGPAPVVVCRLLDSGALREALADAPDCDLVVALSDSLYQDLIVNRFTSLRPEAFTPHLVKVKTFEARAWIRVVQRPGTWDGELASYTDHAMDDRAPQAAAGRGTAGAGRVIKAENYVENTFHGDTTIGVAGFRIDRGRR